MEADSMQQALNYLNEGFLYNTFNHPNNLKFYGCYLSGSTLSTEYLPEQESSKTSSESDVHLSLGQHNLIIGQQTYQVGLITEPFENINMASYFNYFS